MSRRQKLYGTMRKFKHVKKMNGGPALISSVTSYPQSRAAKVLERLYGSDVFKDLESWRKHATLECGKVENSNFVSNRARYLFNIEQDPCELHDLSQEQPQVVSMLLEKLAAYNKTIVPAVNSTVDPRGYPENNGGVWAPWI
ncbi:hypothetical protein HPB50_004144 [Hyalomma asiaticum]|uniref:Uncharacterized protein n=1 Tax=Hyalomma asiaticum TaxID=266040 RepID=A0ACB7SEA7_HYAAI|nr:hypothetical protein HPB50_004144 [Hyalomma asiaticum]